jgi:gliding motility-associated-like protein
MVALMKYLITFLFTINILSAQSDVPLTLRAQFNGKYDYTIIGNTHNTIDNWDPAFPPCEMITESNATLNLLPTQNIVSAFLYLNGCSDGTLANNALLNSSPISPDITFVCDFNPPISPFPYFSIYKDVTAMVQMQGNGTYSVTNFDLNSLIATYCSNRIFFSGWTLIIIYEENILPTVQLNLYHGLRYVGYQNINSIDIPINNLNIIASQNAKISYVAHNGSTNLFDNESILFNDNVLNNVLNPANNPFNGTNAFNNSTTYWNQDIDTFDVSAYINVGDTQANLKLNSGSIRFISNVIASVRSELPDPSLQLTQVSGQDICGSRDLVVNYTVVNTNSNAALPANLPVSFFANDVFLQTVNTPTSIPIGGTLPLQTTVVIPQALGNNIELRVVVNQNASGLAFIPESNPNNNDASQSITLIGNTVTTVFGLQNSFCINNIVPVLPTVSGNGISGLWLPNAINNQTSGSYVFTPTPGQCASNFILNVTISPNVNPTFTIANTICQGATVPTLPLISDNNISGIWTPTAISNQNSGSYIFTPDAGQCSLPLTLNVTVSPNVNPTFTIANTFCQGATVPALPLISTNNISGTWLPTVISNQSSGSYVFTPNTGSCGLPFTLNVVVSPNVNPTFTIANTFCQGASVPALPLISTNNISGTWYPNVISSQNSGSYVFTPNAGQCDLVFTLDVIIETPDVNEETLFICEDANGNTVFPVTLKTELNSGNYTFSWSENGVSIANNLSFLTAFSAGNYEVVASPIGLGCEIIFSFEVLPLQPITVIIAVPKPDFDTNQIIVANASGGSGQYIYSFADLPFQSSPIFNVSDSGSISVVVKDVNGCYTFSETVVIWQFPRFFTPNNDSFNDTWGINTQKQITTEIFDRYGRFIKQLINNQRWAGTFNAQTLPSTDYWFVVYYDENKVYKSHFSLKR